MTKSHTGRKKRGSVAKKPPLAAGSVSGAGMVGKKSKRGLKNINTISHDEESYNPHLAGFSMAQESHFSKKNHSQKRPQTAKTKKQLTMLGAKPKSRVNNFIGSSTPSHKVRGGVKGQQMANTHGLVVPQSQMFTSFGMPASSKLPGQVMSQRRSTKKKNVLPPTSHSQTNFSKKRLRGLSGGSKGKSKRGAAGQPNFQAASV